MKLSYRAAVAPFVLFGLLALGCGADIAANEGVRETEETATEDEELRSAVSCRSRTMIGYPNRDGVGKPMRVVSVGGKAITKATAHAFLKMQRAAQSAGVNLSLTSGFRNDDEQRFLYNCFQNCTASCYVQGVPQCNPADPPGTSAHQKGIAADVSRSQWLYQNANRFGFRRPYPWREPWHVEFDGADPGGPCGAGEGDVATVSPNLPWVSPREDGDYRNGVWMKVRPPAAVAAKIAKVVYTAGNYRLGTSADDANDFAVRYTFKNLGDRSLTATAYDSNGRELYESTVNIHISP